MSQVIYLDDSDFSNLASFPEREDVVGLKRLLTEGIAKGGLLVPFSYVHLATLLPKSKKHTEHSLLRARAIKSLCGENVLIHPTLLHQMEAQLALQSTNSRRSTLQPLRSDGKWFPGFDLHGASAVKPLPRDIEGSRQRRRAYRREITAAIDRQTDNFFKLDAYTSRDRLRNQVEALTYGKIRQAEFNREAERQFYDPENLILRMGKTKSLSKMRQEIDSFGAMFTQAYQELTDITVSLAERAATARAPAPGAREFALQIIRDKLFLGLYDIRRHYFRRLAKNADLPDSVVDKALLKCPGITAVFEYLNIRMLHIFDSVLAGTRTKRSNNPTRFMSDGGDALHLSYLPYVDCFRCDRDTSIALASVGTPQEKVFSSPANLINHLEI